MQRLEQKKSKFIKMAVPFLARFIRLLSIKPHDKSDTLLSIKNALEEILYFMKPFVWGCTVSNCLSLSFFQEQWIMKMFHAMYRSHAVADEKHDINFHWSKH